MQMYANRATCEEHRLMLERAHEIAVRRHRSWHGGARVDVQLIREAEVLQFRCTDPGCRHPHVKVAKTEAT